MANSMTRAMKNVKLQTRAKSDVEEEGMKFHQSSSTKLGSQDRKSRSSATSLVERTGAELNSKIKEKGSD